MELTDNSVPIVALISSQHGGLGIIRSLGRLGIHVYGVHQSAWEPAARSRYLQSVFVWDFTTALAEASVAFLLGLATNISQRPILLPTSDITAVFVADNAELLKTKFFIASASSEVVRGFSSKRRTYDLCKKFSIPTAETAWSQSREEALSFASATQFPVIVKGEHGEFLIRENENARVAIVPDKKDLLNIFDLNSRTGSPNLIFQEYIPGGDDTVWMFNGYFDEKGDCLFGATGRKLRQYPAHRGSTSLGVCEKNETVAAQTIRLMQAVGYRGPLDIGCRFDARDCQYKLLDVNPRIGATFRLFAAENGSDVARALYLHLTGQPVDPAQVCEGRKWIVETNDFVSSIAAMRERQLSVGEWFRSVKDVHEGAWLSWRDPAPLFSLPFLYWRKQSRRHTVAEQGAKENARRD